MFEELHGKRYLCAYKSGKFSLVEMHYYSTTQILVVKNGINKFRILSYWPPFSGRTWYGVFSPYDQIQIEVDSLSSITQMGWKVFEILLRNQTYCRKEECSCKFSLQTKSISKNQNVYSHAFLSISISIKVEIIEFPIYYQITVKKNPAIVYSESRKCSHSIDSLQKHLTW